MRPSSPVQQTVPIYREVSQESGINIYGRGRGSAWGDLDGDGDLDFGVGLQEGGFHLYRNQGNLQFTDVTESSGAQITDTVFGISFIDVDNDGDLDIFLSCGGFQAENPHPHANHLLLNDGHGGFEEVPGAGGLSLPGYGFSASWSDVNGDSFLDIYLCRTAVDGTTADGRLFLNRGGASFVDATEEAGVSTLAFSQQALFFDVEGDGDPDLFLANRTAGMLDPRSGNQLFLNDGTGRFNDASASSRLGGFGAGFSAAVADVDRDGDLDLFVGAFNYQTRDTYFPGEPDHLFLNDGKGRFSEVGESAGVASLGGSMGATFLDFDNDGWPDLYVARGGPETDRLELDRLYRNLGDGKFEEVARVVGISNRAAGHGVTTADADWDGDLDILVPSGGFTPDVSAPCLLFENIGVSGASLALRVQGQSGNVAAIGAKVIVETQGHTTLQELLAGSGFASQNPAVAWFGLGDASHADRVTVIWPDGLTRSGGSIVPQRNRMVLRPVRFLLHDPEVDPTDPASGRGRVRLSWEDPRPGVDGRFAVVVRRAENDSVVARAQGLTMPGFVAELSPGAYVCSVELSDVLGIVSYGIPDELPFVVEAPSRPPGPPVWKAFPNPFRESVTLVGGGYTEGSIRIDILDIQGRELVTSFVAVRNGNVRWTWEARTAKGVVIPAGIYFARIEGLGFRETVKLVKVNATFAR